MFLDKIGFVKENGNIFLNLWEDERIAIPFCTCNKKLKRSTFGKWEDDDRILDILRYENSKRIIINLKRFGIPFEEQKEVKPLLDKFIDNDFIDNDQNA